MSGWIFLLIFLAVIGLIILMMMPSAIKLTPDTLKIGKSLAIEIPYNTINEVKLNNQYPKTINRVRGFDSGDVKIGVFENPYGEQITLNLFLEYPPFIEVFHKKGLLVFNTNNHTKTEKLYRDLSAKLSINHVPRT